MMYGFIATDGSHMAYDTLPTLKAVVELFNFIWELERGEGAAASATPCNVAGGATAGESHRGGSEYNYRD